MVRKELEETTLAVTQSMYEEERKARAKPPAKESDDGPKALQKG